MHLLTSRALTLNFTKLLQDETTTKTTTTTPIFTFAYSSLEEKNDKLASKVTLILLAAMLGWATPLLVKNIFRANWKRVLHVANAVQSLLFLLLSILTLVLRFDGPVPIETEAQCVAYRLSQSILFLFFVISYEFVLGYKAKAIMGSRTICGGRISLGTALLIFTMTFRVVLGSLSVYSTGIKFVDGKCFNTYDHPFIKMNSLARNVIDVMWAILFALPIYKILALRRLVLQSIKRGVSGRHHQRHARDMSDTTTATSEEIRNESFYRNIKSSPYSKIFIANCLYPVIGNIITFSIAILIIRNEAGLRRWQTLLYGIQNFIASYTVNIILNLKVIATRPVQPSVFGEVTTCVGCYSTKGNGIKSPKKGGGGGGKHISTASHNISETMYHDCNDEPVDMRTVPTRGFSGSPEFKQAAVTSYLQSLQTPATQERDSSDYSLFYYNRAPLPPPPALMSTSPGAADHDLHADDELNSNNDPTEITLTGRQDSMRHFTDRNNLQFTRNK